MPHVLLLQTHISAENRPTVSLDQAVLAIAILRGLGDIDPSSFRVVLSHTDDWSDIRPKNWGAPAVVIAPEMLFSMLFGTSRTGTTFASLEIAWAEHSLLSLDDKQIEEAKNVLNQVWEESAEIYEQDNPDEFEDDDEPTFLPEPLAIVRGLGLPTDEYSDALLRAHVWYYYSENWQDELSPELAQLEEALSVADDITELIVDMAGI